MLIITRLITKDLKKIEILKNVEGLAFARSIPGMGDETSAKFFKLTFRYV